MPRVVSRTWRRDGICGDFRSCTAAGSRLESAITCDSLAYSVGLYGPTEHHGPRFVRTRMYGPASCSRKVASKGVFSSLAEVKVQEGESIESALRRFKRKVQQEDIIKDIKKHSFYLKPGDRRRAKQALARKRTRKKQRRETE